MEKFKRIKDESRIYPLVELGEKWGEEWSLKKHNWNWKKKYKGRKIHIKQEILEPVFMEVNNNRCAFCDFFPLIHDCGGEMTIEHFLPKEKYPEKAFIWENLFPSCKTCNNKKGNKDPGDALKPDSEKYDFDKFFIANHDGSISVKMDLTELEYSQAKETQDLYKLNRVSLKEMRRKRKERYFNLLNELKNPRQIVELQPIEEEPFQFYIKRLLSDYMAIAGKSNDQIFNQFL